jgi:F420-non-reducing hydrogenase iron-sulfur subunit
MRIIAFVCNWCARAGVELAAYERIGYPDVEIIHVNCTGRIDAQLILQTLERADGIVICACHLGDDHYGTGNYKTLKKVLLTKKILEQLGINPERLRLEWISSTEADRFAEAIREMKETLESEVFPS